MARLKTYDLDGTVSDNDIIIGSNGDTPNIGETKNFTVGTLRAHLEDTLQLEPTPGPQGPEGPRGYTGPRGLPGLNGQDGLQGNTGIKGDKGEKGDKGDTGDQGVQGIVGPTGAQGIQGVQGLKGDKGDTGDVGPMAIVNPDGITIVKGDKGDKGDPGQDGAQGAEGATGPQGPQGLQGLQGLQGIQGLKGDKGDNGDTGSQGPQGLQGTTGATGAAGPQGLKGDTGNTGPQGPQGLQGATGATGAQGPKGDTGSTGPQGPIGLTGPAGPQGVPGTGTGDTLQKEITGDYTITDADKGYRLFFNSPNPITVTIDELTTPNFESMFYNIGAGTVTFSSGTASVDYPNNDTLTTDSMGWLIKFMNSNIYKLKAGAVDGTTSGSGSIGGGGGTPGYFLLDANIIAKTSATKGWGFYSDDFIEHIPSYTQATFNANTARFYGSVDAQYLLAASGNATYSVYSQNGGQSWISISQNLSYNRNHGVVSDNGRVMLLWYENSTSFNRQPPMFSNAYGSNFSSLPTMQFTPSVSAFASFCNCVKMSCDGEKLVAVVRGNSESINKAFLSVDRGATFNPITGLPSNTVNNMDSIRDAFISNDGLTIGLISSTPGFVDCLTRDGGTTWNDITMPSGSYFNKESIYSNNCKYVYLKNDYSVYRSEDYGLNFVEVTLPFFEGTLDSFSCSSGGEFVTINSATTTILNWVSKDFGKTFTKMNIPSLYKIQIL